MRQPEMPQPGTPVADRSARTATTVLLVAATGFVLCALVAATDRGPVQRFDTGTEHTVHGWALAHPGLTRGVQWLTDVGGPAGVRDALLVAGLVLAVRRSWRRLGWVALAGLGIGPLNEGLKRLVARARPLLDDPVSSAGGLSYPSGHASSATVLALVVVLLLRPHLGRRGRTAAVAVGVTYAGALGVSRVWLGVHYPTDVLGGWLLGTAWVAGTYAARRPDRAVRPARCR